MNVAFVPLHRGSHSDREGAVLAAGTGGVTQTGRGAVLAAGTGALSPPCKTAGLLSAGRES